MSDYIVPMPEKFEVLQIGITTRCNLVCKHCPRDNRYVDKSEISLEKFMSYLKNFQATQFNNLLISDFGEVTIVKDFLNYLRFAKSQGFRRLSFVTNATRNDRKFWQAITEEHLVSNIIISLEGLGSCYQDIRGHSFSHFLKVVNLISELFNSASPPIPFKLSVVCMQQNLDHLVSIVDLAADIGAAELYFVHLNPTSFKNDRPEKLCTSAQHLDSTERVIVVNTFAKVLERAITRNLKIKLPESFSELQRATTTSPTPMAPKEIDFFCGFPFKWVQVGIGGNVFPCCQMSQKVFMGNIKDQSFHEMWNAPKYQELLNGLRVGGKPLDICQKCNVFRGHRF